MAFPDILIGSKFDAKGFKQAESSISKLTKNVKFAAGALGVALSAKAVANFGKAAVDAFAKDQKAAALLTNTVKNLGLAFADADIRKFIDNLSLAAGVADDQLRPAFQRLLQATGSLEKSQTLLKQSIDISKGSSQSLETVVLDVANAYVGNNKGLKKYTLGLSAAELKTASFDKVMQAFNRNFSGANAAYLDTYAGKLEQVKIGAQEATEQIGSGLVDAFKILGADSNLGNLAEKMKSLATSIGDFFRGLAQGFKDLSNYPVIKQLLQLSGLMLKVIGKVAGGVVNPFVQSGANYRASQITGSSANAHLAELNVKQTAAAKAKAEKDALKNAKNLTTAQTKQTAELKKQAQTKKQSALFDMEQIQLVAALQGKLSKEDQDRVRLQLALLQGNDELAAKLSARVADAIDGTGRLREWLTSLPDANNPFKGWDAWLMNFKNQLASVTTMTSSVIGGGAGNSQVMPQTNTLDFGGNQLGTAVPNYIPAPAGTYGTASGAVQGPVIVQIDGKTIASTLMDQSLSGNQTYIDRRTGGFNFG